MIFAYLYVLDGRNGRKQEGQKEGNMQKCRKRKEEWKNWGTEKTMMSRKANRRQENRGKTKGKQKKGRRDGRNKSSNVIYEKWQKENEDLRKTVKWAGKEDTQRGSIMIYEEKKTTNAGRKRTEETKNRWHEGRNTRRKKVRRLTKNKKEGRQEKGRKEKERKETKKKGRKDDRKRGRKEDMKKA